MAPKNIKGALNYNKGGYNHLVGEVGPASEETLHTCQSNINKEASASLRHTTHLLILRDKFRFAIGEEGEREWCISWRGLFVLA